MSSDSSPSLGPSSFTPETTPASPAARRRPGARVVAGEGMPGGEGGDAEAGEAGEARPEERLRRVERRARAADGEREGGVAEARADGDGLARASAAAGPAREGEHERAGEPREL